MVKKTHNIKCQCPTCKTNINIEVDVNKKVNRGAPICETASCTPGAQGLRGIRGIQGTRGVRGPAGPQGPAGTPGSTGVQGATGPLGPEGTTGAQGLTGPIGPTGTGNRWFIGTDNCSPTGTSEQAQPGDLMLNLTTCGICEYTSNNEWIETDQSLNCLKCDDVYTCLKSLPQIDPELHGNCHVTLILNDLAAVFNSGSVAITQLVIADEIQDISAVSGMTFSTPQQLANLLSNLDTWEYNSAFQTNIYVLSLTIAGDINDTNTYISFGNGDTYNMLLQCFCPPDNDCFPCEEFGSTTQILACKSDKLRWIDAGCLGLTGPTGPTGLQGATGLQGVTGQTGYTGLQGPTGIVTCQELYRTLVYDVPEPAVTLCEFCGFFDPNCFNFLNMINQTFFIATAYNTPANLVSPLVSFADETEYQQALNQLNIVIVDSAVKVTQSPDLINRIYYFNSSQNLIASITLVQTNCCPTGVDQNNQVLTKLPPNGANDNCRLAWVPAHCLVKPEIDLEQEICQLPECLRYRCCVIIDITQPFFANPGLHPLPWEISEMIVFGVDVTADYVGDINSYDDFGTILESNGWEPIFPNSNLYRLCRSSSEPITDTLTSIKIIDDNSIIFFCRSTSFSNDNGFGSSNGGGGLDIECTDTQDLTPRDIQMVYKTNNGVALGDVTKIFDSFDICEDVSYNCQTLLPTECFLSDIRITGPWRFTAITVGGISQTVISSSFSTKDELEQLLVDMGWTNNGNGVYSIFQNLSAPATVSSVTIQSVPSPGTTQTISLEITCSANCGPTADLRLVLTRDDSNNYCWLSPECLRQGPTNVITCCEDSSTCGLTKIPSCDISPKFDLKLKLYQQQIELIDLHFSGSGDYWIYGYETDEGNVVQLNQPIGTPFSLRLLATAFANLSDPWVTDTPLHTIDSETEKVEMTKLNTCDLIVKFLINENGQDGLTAPFNYCLSIDSLTGQDCPGLSPDAQVLIKDNNDFCFVDVACLMPIIPDPINLSNDLCDLDVCNEDLLYRVCIRLSECDIEKWRDTFGSGQNLEIAEYRLLEGGPVDVAQIIGADPTLTDAVNAFLNAGWTTPDPFSSTVELYLVTPYNITYVAINRVGASPAAPPYAYLIPASCTLDSNCPSTDPVNKVLIRTPDDKICWTPICPIRGPKGNTGLTGMTGPTGPAGEPGPDGGMGPTGPPGPAGQEGPMGGPGAQGAIGLQGPTGSPGTEGAMGAQGAQGFQGVPGGGAGPQGASGPEGPTGPPGPLGLMGTPGMDGAQGATGPQGPTGAQGDVGPPGISADVQGENCGNGCEVFKQRVGDTFEFRTLEEDTNINLSDTPDEITIAVRDNFNWEDTQFQGGSNANSGGGIVLSGSSLTFQNGAVLYVDNIEETTASNGVVLDTSSGSGVTIMDGGVEFQNNLVGVQGVTSTTVSRRTFLEYFNFGCFSGSFEFSGVVTGPSIDIGYQRIGNMVTVLIPSITSVNLVNAGGSKFLTFDTTVPNEVAPEQDVTFLFTYFEINTGDWIDGTITFATNGQIRIGVNIDNDMFPAGFGISSTGSHTRSFTYNVIPTPL